VQRILRGLPVSIRMLRGFRQNGYSIWSTTRLARGAVVGSGLLPQGRVMIVHYICAQ
jgi:hypothetical protein